MPQAIAIFAATALWALLFGWMRDRPGKVHAEESILERGVQWASAAFHVGGAVLFLIGAHSAGEHMPFVLMTAYTWCVFAALVLARRTAATYTDPGVVHLKRWWTGLGVARWAMAVWPAVLYVGVMMLPHYGGWQLPLYWPTAALVVWIFTRSYLTGRDIQRHAVKSAATIRDFQNVLAKVFGVSQGEIEQYGHMYLERGGDLVMSTVPAGVADALRRKGLDELDAAMAGMRPDWMISDESDHDEIVITPVTDERRARRAELARTGGVFVTSEPADDETSPESMPDYIDWTNKEW